MQSCKLTAQNPQITSTTLRINPQILTVISEALYTLYPILLTLLQIHQPPCYSLPKPSICLPPSFCTISPDIHVTCALVSFGPSLTLILKQHSPPTTINVHLLIPFLFSWYHYYLYQYYLLLCYLIICFPMQCLFSLLEYKFQEGKDFVYPVHCCILRA